MKKLGIFMLVMLVLGSFCLSVAQAAPMGTAFTYQGRLTDGGNLANGNYDFEFRLFDVSSGSTALATVALNDIPVSQGHFTVVLDFGNGRFTGDARWLEIGVRPGASPGAYTTLSTRQTLTPTPYALYAASAPTGGGGDITSVIAGTGLTGGGISGDVPLNVNFAGSGAAGTVSHSDHDHFGSLMTGNIGSYGFQVNNQGTGDGLRAYSAATAYNYAAVYAVNTSTGSGVYTSSYGDGVYAVSNGQGKYAVLGRSSIGPGIKGESLDRSGNGVEGYGYSGIYGWTNLNYGNSAGVYGESVGSDGNGVIGVAHTGTNAWAVVGSSNNGIGGKFYGGRIGVYSQTGPSGYAAIFEGKTSTRVLEITGGADFSENFDIRGFGKVPDPAPGMVVIIDPREPGKLIVSDKAYDRKVAGIISGAGGVKPGMIMGQEGTQAHGSSPVALSGRVYCWADASHGTIEPGDLLTSSDVPGHAMKVGDYTKAQGAVIGKAMTGLQEGKGLVLVLVTLQ